MKKIFFSAKPIVSILAIFILSFAGAVGLRIAIAAWTGPSAAPPGSNVGAPLNVGATIQTKSGELILSGGLTILNSADARLKTDANGLIVDISDNGTTNLYVADTQVSVRGSIYDIADDTVNVGENLSITGTIGGTGWGIVPGLTTSKLTINIVDPLYDIAGTKYSTYVASMTGLKEETTGNVNLKCEDNKCVSVIDFDKVEKGSDLWLFYQVTDFGKNWDNLVALLTPEGKNNIWYEVNSGEHQLLIYGEKEGRVSYRLTAPRLDHEKWLNLNQDSNAEGMKVNLK